MRVPSIRPRGRERRLDEPNEQRDGQKPMRWGPGGPWFVGLVIVAFMGLTLSLITGSPIPRDLWTAFVVAAVAAILWSTWRTYRRDGMTRTVVASMIHLGAFLALIASFHVGFGKDLLWAIALIGFAVAWAVIYRRI